jgi:hypothetical protein
MIGVVTQPIDRYFKEGAGLKFSQGRWFICFWEGFNFTRCSFKNFDIRLISRSELSFDRMRLNNNIEVINLYGFPKAANRLCGQFVFN